MSAALGSQGTAPRTGQLCSRTRPTERCWKSRAGATALCLLLGGLCLLRPHWGQKGPARPRWAQCWGRRVPQRGWWGQHVGHSLAHGGSPHSPFHRYSQPKYLLQTRGLSRSWLRSVQGSAPWPGSGLPPGAAMLVHWGRVGAVGSRCPARRAQTARHRGPGLCFLLQGRVRPPRSCCAAAGAGTREHFSNPAFGCSPWVWGRVVNVPDACRWVGARAAGAPPPPREAPCSSTMGPRAPRWLGRTP